MRVEGTYTIKADVGSVWAALQDPEALAGCIPGCERFEAQGEDTYEIALKAGVGPVTAAYSGRLVVADKVVPESYRMLVEGGGVAGTVRGEVLLRLTEEGGETTIEIVGDAQVTGTVARVGQRFMGSASRLLMGQFFSCMKAKIEAG